MKDCMFQYATKNKVIADTVLITREEAIELWNKNKDDFIKRLRNEEEPEMCIWINCKDESWYSESIMHVDQDSHVINGDIYSLVRVG